MSNIVYHSSYMAILFWRAYLIQVTSLCKRSGEPVYLTKNSEGDLVVMDVEAFARRKACCG